MIQKDNEFKKLIQFVFVSALWLALACLAICGIESAIRFLVAWLATR
jgi:NADH:ubiquinone oxidoreductase subunit B-like Fe-S oxidoreductase